MGEDEVGRVRGEDVLDSGLRKLGHTKMAPDTWRDVP